MTPGDNPAEQPKTVEEYQALLKVEQAEKEKFKERAIWAEKLIENKKKKAKDSQPNPSLWEEEVRKILAEEAFYKNNPELAEHKARISELTSNGISLEVAKMQVESEDPTIANRAKARQSDFANWDAWWVMKTITQEELSEKPQKEFENIMKLSKQGKVKII